MSLSCSEDDHKIKPKEPPCLYCVQFLYLREGSFINNTCGLIRNKENVNVETFLWKLLSTSHQDPVSGQACNPLDFHWSLILLFCGEDLVPVTTQPLNTTSGTNLLHLEGLNPSDRHKTSDRQTDRHVPQRPGCKRKQEQANVSPRPRRRPKIKAVYKVRAILHCNYSTLPGHDTKLLAFRKEKEKTPLVVMTQPAWLREGL